MRSQANISSRVAGRVHIAPMHWLLLALLLCAPHCFAAYLESDEQEAPAPAPVPLPRPPVRIIPLEPPRPPAAVRELLRRVQVEQAYTDNGIRVFPLSLRSGGHSSGIRTLDEAVRRGWLVVREQEKARVPFVTVRNESRYPVFCMAGEILVGGKQNRILREDVLIPPESGNIDIAVYCVEQDRWHGPGKRFDEVPGVAHRGLRMAAAKDASQDSVWEEIASFSRRLGAVSATKDYSAVFDEPDVKEWLADVLPRFRRVLRAGHVGAVVVAGNRILGCDLFSDADVFAQLRDKVLRSYLLEYAGRVPRKHTDVEPDDIRRFLDQALVAEFAHRPTPGVGSVYDIRRNADGTALVWRDRLVHMALYPDVLVRPLQE